MKFAIHVRPASKESSSPPILEAENWLQALRSYLEGQGESLDMAQINFSLYEDGLSAKIEDLHRKRSYKLLVLSSPEAPPPPPATGSLSAPVVAGSSTFNPQGLYSPGSTVDVLTDAFMKLAQLYEHFQKNRSAAIQYIQTLLQKSIRHDGCGILLTDINDPTKAFWFEASHGPHADLLSNLRWSPEQGILQKALESPGGLLLPDLSNAPAFQTEFLADPTLQIGSLACLPLQASQRLHGALLLYRSLGQPPFVKGEISILMYFATVLGEYLERFVEQTA